MECYLSSGEGEQRRGARGLGLDFVHRRSEKEEVSVVLNFSYLVAERLEQFLHGGMF